MAVLVLALGNPNLVKKQRVRENFTDLQEDWQHNFPS
jgi:hypothetical protein